MATLMVFEHQARVTNLITKLQREYAIAGAESRHAAIATDELADSLLFVDEADIPERIVSTSGFAEWFSRREPRDPSGRSLFPLDLSRRLFRYPVSYMVYSTVFDSLPRTVRAGVYSRIATALSQPDVRGLGRDLSAEDRTGALDILESTKDEFAYYRHRQ